MEVKINIEASCFHCGGRLEIAKGYSGGFMHYNVDIKPCLKCSLEAVENAASKASRDLAFTEGHNEGYLDGYRTGIEDGILSGGKDD